MCLSKKLGLLLLLDIYGVLLAPRYLTDYLNDSHFVTRT
jgi:hypothetical protein